MTNDSVGLENLIIVPGHAVYVGTEASHADKDEHWVGGFPGEGAFYAQHVDAGILQAAKDNSGLLVFSGGQTRKAAGPLSEAQSYWFLANQKKWNGHNDVKGRATTEEFARDSLENLEFGLYRFRQFVGKEPALITVCGWGFKETRYRAHCSAIGWDVERFAYVCVNDPAGKPEDVATPFGQSVAGEKKTLADFTQFPLGNGGKLLEKRMARDPFKRGNTYCV